MKRPLAELFAPLTEAEKARPPSLDTLPTKRPAPGFSPIMPAPLDVLAEAERTFYRGGPVGKLATGWWPYLDGDGNTLFIAFRWQPAEGRKQFGYLTYGVPDGEDTAPRWHLKAPPALRPLFNLYGLSERPDAPVLVVEGEKAADAAGCLDWLAEYVPVTSAGGSNAPEKSDWSPLKGRRVLIMPDNDEPGRKYAARVAELAWQAGAIAVQTYEYPSHFPNGWDVADPLPNFGQTPPPSPAEAFSPARKTA